MIKPAIHDTKPRISDRMISFTLTSDLGPTALLRVFEDVRPLSDVALVPVVVLLPVVPLFVFLLSVVLLFAVVLRPADLLLFTASISSLRYCILSPDFVNHHINLNW
jgi:hypothetical protein